MELIFFVIIPLTLLGLCAWLRFGSLPVQVGSPTGLNPIPIAGLLVILTGVVLGHEFFNKPVGPIPITIDRLILILATGLFGFLVLAGREKLRPLNWLDISILILLTVIGLSTISHDWKILSNMPLSRLLFFNLMPAGLYYLVRSCKLKPADLKFIGCALGGFGVYLAVTALFETRGLTGLVFPRYIMTSETTEFLGRGRGPFLNPVSNGIFMTTCFCFVMMWWPRTKVTGRVLLLAVGLLIALGIYSTLTRSVWLTFVCACAIYIFWPAENQFKGLMIIAGTIAGIVLFPVISEKVFSFKRDKGVSVSQMEISAQMRPMFLIVATNMFKDRPLLGVGFGQYPKAKFPYLKDPKTDKPLTITKTLMQHNVFLAYLTETGLVGVSVLLLMLILMFNAGWQVWSDTSLDLCARQFGLVGIVILTCYCINGMFHDVSIIPLQHLYMFFLMGLINNIYSDRAPFRSAEASHEGAISQSAAPQIDYAPAVTPSPNQAAY